MDTEHATIFPWKTEDLFTDVDVFEKWVEVYTAPRESSLGLASFLYTEIVQQHSCPNFILTNNKPTYVRVILQAECHRWGLQHLTSADTRPKGNGLAKRSIGKLKQCIKCITNGDFTLWTECLGISVMAYQHYHTNNWILTFHLMYRR